MMDEAVAELDGVVDGINSFECKKKFALQEGYSVWACGRFLDSYPHAPSII